MNDLSKQFAADAKRVAIQKMGHPSNLGIFSARDFQEALISMVVCHCAKLAHDTHPDDWPFISSKLLQEFGIKV